VADPDSVKASEGRFPLSQMPGLEAFLVSFCITAGYLLVSFACRIGTHMDDATAPNTWLELLDALYADDCYPTVRHHRSSFACRGMLDASWDMPTSLIRLGGAFQELEKHMLRNFRRSTETWFFWQTQPSQSALTRGGDE